jgi:hypothetical protein
MGNRKWMGAVVGGLAGLALACSGMRSSERGDTASGQKQSTGGQASAGGQAGSDRSGTAQGQARTSKDQPGGAQSGASQGGIAGGPSAGSPDTSATAAAQPQQPPVQVLPTVVGRVTSIDHAGMLRIQPEGKDEVALKVDPSSTTIAIDGREGKLNDLAPGTEVRASYEEAQGTKNAVTVSARTAAGAPGAPTTPPGASGTAPGSTTGAAPDATQSTTPGSTGTHHGGASQTTKP